MEAKRDIEEKAKSLIDTDPYEALKLYKELYEAYKDKFNNWDALFSLKASRRVATPDLAWAKELVGKYHDNKVQNLYGWLIYDNCVKGKQDKEILQNESTIAKLPELSPQKNCQEDNSYPCPTTICILKLADAHSNTQFNAKKINQILSNLDYNLLSSKPKKIETQEKGEVKIASDLEKYLALRTKSLLKIGNYLDTKELCQFALQCLENFHYNNDIWFKMRLAISEERIGNLEISESLFKELLASKAGSDKWFLYRDIANVYFEQEEYSKAWKYAIDAAYFGTEPQFLVKLYLDLTRILYKLNRHNEGKIFAELIGAILNEQGWNERLEYSRLFQFYEVERSNLPSVDSLVKKVMEFIRKERYGGLKRVEGTIISVHKNGKLGRIKSSEGTISDFHKKNLQKQTKNLHELKGITAEYYEIEGEDGKLYAEEILPNKPQKSTQNTELIGKSLEGKVKAIVDFGIFVQLPEMPDGLLHRNNMPNDIKDSFKDEFKDGDRIKVVIKAETNKGIELKYE